MKHTLLFDTLGQIFHIFCMQILASFSPPNYGRWWDTVVPQFSFCTSRKSEREILGIRQRTGRYMQIYRQWMRQTERETEQVAQLRAIINSTVRQTDRWASRQRMYTHRCRQHTTYHYNVTQLPEAVQDHREDHNLPYACISASLSASLSTERKILLISRKPTVVHKYVDMVLITLHSIHCQCYVWSVLPHYMWLFSFSDNITRQSIHGVHNNTIAHNNNANYSIT